MSATARAAYTSVLTRADTALQMLAAAHHGQCLGHADAKASFSNYGVATVARP